MSQSYRLPYSPRDQEEMTMAHEHVTDEELAELIQRTVVAAKAYIRGDMRTYFSLIQAGDDYTFVGHKMSFVI
jgi:hypothetical protein